MTTEQLITDESFIDWVRSGSKETDVPWTNEQDSMIQENIDEARQIIESLHFNDIKTTPSRKNEIWSNISNNIDKKGNRSSRFKSLWLLVLIGLVLLTSLIVYNILQNNTSHTTDFAELKKIEFPDGSLGILNANSELQFEKDWEGGKKRKVSLSGEAYFDVSHLENHETFIVETEHVNIEVLGTKFVVNCRPYGAQITLEEGKIRLLDKSSNEELKVLDPGQTGFFDIKTSRFNLESKDISLYTSWKTGTLQFNKTPFSEVVRIIKENYGFNIRVEDQAIWEEEISGAIATRSINDLKTALEGILNIEIETRDNLILFK